MRSRASAGMFLKAHRRLLLASYAFDLLLVPLGLVYLMLPLSMEGLSPANLGFLGLGALVAFLYHIHILRLYTGGPAFYLTIPVNRWLGLGASYAVALLPFMALFTAVALAFHPSPPLAGRAVFFPLQERLTHCLTVFFFLKVLSPPVLVMSRTHPALLLLIPLGLGAAWGGGTIAGEMMGSPLIGQAVFLILVALLSIGTVAKAKN